MSRQPNYECWRVSGDTQRLVIYCPTDAFDECMDLEAGDACSLGKTLVHGADDYQLLNIKEHH